MAKTTNCQFCNKEITKGLFKGEVVYMVFGAYSITCCDSCYEKYKEYMELHKKRFEIKLDNSIKSKKAKYSEQEISKMFLAYCNEYEKQNEKCGFEVIDKVNRFYTFNDNGYFSVREFGISFSNQDINAKHMIKSLDKSVDTQCISFDKDDITRIEYAIISSDQLGLFNQAISFAIRFNDEKIVTYKPCVTRTAFLGSGFLFGYRKSAERKLLEELNMFKKLIGSDLPIIKVNKIGWKGF